MPSKQKHRGHHQQDPKLFAASALPNLNQAVSDLSWLLTRHYPDKAAIKLVGDRYRLTQRHRKALLRASCSDVALELRRKVLIPTAELEGTSLAVDGYNLLITIESGLAGGYVFECRDGCYRDIASVHGTYRKVEETLPALSLIGHTLQKLGVKEVNWFLDKPVSNSGRLKILMYEVAEEQGFPWKIRLVNNPDKVLLGQEGQVIISSDGWVLDQVARAFNLHRYIVDHIPDATIIRLTGN
jgi:hypothetical protein